MSYGTVQIWERGESAPDVKNLEKIAIAEGITLQELLEYLEEPEQGSATEAIVKKFRFLSRSEVAEIAKAALDRLAEQS